MLHKGRGTVLAGSPGASAKQCVERRVEKWDGVARWGLKEKNGRSGTVGGYDILAAFFRRRYS